MTNLYTLSLKEGLEDENSLKSIFINSFQLSDKKGTDILKSFKHYTSHLRDSIYLVVETNYVDKVYRDSYYCYYSTKLEPYHRNCIKISFFDVEIEPDMFYNPDSHSALNKAYLGFMIVRPLAHSPIGRSVISPKALIENNIRICNTYVHSTAAGLKFDVVGFPHSSQDSETMTCAETTIWALMEYFGNKYPEYNPILPSRILSTLEHRAFSRQVPSRGLIYEDISYALRKEGFGTVIYSQDSFGENDFKKIFSCYIESGVPIVVAIKNNDIGHALLCVGRNDDSSIDVSKITPITTDEGIKIYEWNNNIEDFVFIDDNMPLYQKAKFEDPTAHYVTHGSTKWKDCKISHFIVPLYHKVYLEADNAIKISNYIATHEIVIDENSVVRTFLTSCRSYKNYIVKNKSINADLKEMLITLEMPKFIWITEISSLERELSNLIHGTIILDATEANTKDYAPLVFAHYKRHIYCFSKQKNIIKKNVLPLHSVCDKYEAFESNLKVI